MLLNEMLPNSNKNNIPNLRFRPTNKSIIKLRLMREINLPPQSNNKEAQERTRKSLPLLNQRLKNITPTPVLVKKKRRLYPPLKNP